MTDVTPILHAEFLIAPSFAQMAYQPLMLTVDATIYDCSADQLAPTLSQFEFKIQKNTGIQTNKTSSKIIEMFQAPVVSACNISRWYLVDTTTEAKIEDSAMLTRVLQSGRDLAAVPMDDLKIDTSNLG